MRGTESPETRRVYGEPTGGMTPSKIPMTTTVPHHLQVDDKAPTRPPTTHGPIPIPPQNLALLNGEPRDKQTPNQLPQGAQEKGILNRAILAELAKIQGGYRGLTMLEETHKYI